MYTGWEWQHSNWMVREGLTQEVTWASPAGGKGGSGVEAFEHRAAQSKAIRSGNKEEAIAAKEKRRNKDLGGEEEVRLERCQPVRKRQGPPGLL